jgi:hypothetical protein
MHEPREIHMVEAIRGPSMGCMWRIGQVSLVGCTSIRITWLSDMSNRLFVAVNT